MTSAPRSARLVVGTGAAMKLAASITRTPASNAAALMARAAMSRASRRRRLALGEEPERQQRHADADRGVRHVAVRAEAVRRTRRAVKWFERHWAFACRSVSRRNANSATPTLIAESATWHDEPRQADRRRAREHRAHR